MPVAGLRGTGDWGTDERPKNFRESIQWMNPNGDTPMTALMGRVGSRSTDDPEFSWWSEPMDLVRLQCNGAPGTSGTVITVDSGDPTAAAIKSNYGKATHLVPGDILMVEPSADSATFDYEQMVVTQVHSDTQFSVARAQFGTSADNIANDQFLLKIGSAFAEGTSEPQAATRNPVKFFNYTQIFKTTYELTNTARATRARTGDVRANDKKRRMFDHSRDLEFALMFGTKSESTDAITGKPIRTMDGIRKFIPAANTTILAASWGLAKSAASGNNLMDAISPVFDYNTPAGDTRVAFCGNGTLNAINKAISDSSGSSGIVLNMDMSEKLWGMNFRRLQFPQGSILLKTHPLLSRHSMYTYSMWVLDFAAIKWVPLSGRDTKPIDEIQTKGEDTTRGMWITEAGIEVDYAGQTLGYIGGFDAAPA